MDIIGSVNQLLKNDMFAALVDPVDRGVVRKLPPADFNHRVVVFLTRGLRLPRSGVEMADMDLTERYTIMVNTAVAMYTRRHFEGIKSTGAFVGDEMSFYRGLSVLKPLIQDQDRTGRKFGKFVMAGSQTDDEFRDDEYRLVRKRVVMGQETNDNATGSLDWADFDTSPSMVRELVTNTSPLDPDSNNLPMKGRAGEAFFNDGVSKGKIRVLPQLQSSIERLADTSTSKFIRYDGTRVDEPEQPRKQVEAAKPAQQPQPAPRGQQPAPRPAPRSAQQPQPNPQKPRGQQPPKSPQQGTPQQRQQRAQTTGQPQQRRNPQGQPRRGAQPQRGSHRQPQPPRQQPVKDTFVAKEPQRRSGGQHRRKED